MNAISGGFYQIDNEVIDKHISVIGVYGLAVYNAIVRFANKNSNAFPSYQTLATTLGISRRKVIDSMNVLIEVGLIEKTKRTSESGDPTSNLYTLVNLKGGACNALPSEQKGDQVHDMHYGSEQDAPGVVHDMHPNNKQLEQDLPEQEKGVEDLDEISATGQLPEAETILPQKTDDLPGLDDWPPKKVPVVTKPNAMGKTTSTTKLHRVSSHRKGEEGLFDPRKLKDKRVPAGTGATPCEILFEFMPYNAEKMSVSILERVHFEAVDLEKWRKTLADCDGIGWNGYNITDRLDVYKNGFKYRNGAANGKSKSSLHKNGATQNGSAKTNPLYAQFG